MLDAVCIQVAGRTPELMTARARPALPRPDTFTAAELTGGELAALPMTGGVAPDGFAELTFPPVPERRGNAR